MYILLILALLSIHTALGNKKVVLISGATRGIGLAAVKAFHDNGWSVWAGVHTYVPEELKNIDHIHLCELDVSSDTSVQAAVDTVLAHEGKIDLLINNAGYGIIGAEECVTIKQAQDLFNVNFFGVLRLIQAVLPGMRQRRSGHIISISSAAGVQAVPGMGLYSASKFALEGLMETLAPTIAHWHIYVSLVEPGFVHTGFTQHSILGSRTCQEERYTRLTQGTLNLCNSADKQSCTEVAEQLVTIANSKKPSFRYQTSPDITAYIAEKLVDPTGDIINRENKQFVSYLLR